MVLSVGLYPQDMLQYHDCTEKPMTLTLVKQGKSQLSSLALRKVLDYDAQADHVYDCIFLQESNLNLKRNVAIYRLQYDWSLKLTVLHALERLEYKPFNLPLVTWTLNGFWVLPDLTWTCATLIRSRKFCVCALWLNSRQHELNIIGIWRTICQMLRYLSGQIEIYVDFHWNASHSCPSSTRLYF